MVLYIVAVVYVVLWAACFRGIFRRLNEAEFARVDGQAVVFNFGIAAILGLFGAWVMPIYWTARRLPVFKDPEVTARTLGGETKDQKIGRLQREKQALERKQTEQERYISQLEEDVGITPQ